MTRFTAATTRLALLVVVAAAAPTVLAIDVKINHDKTFDFKEAPTWTWSAQRGDVKMARTQSDDPAAMRKLAEPVIMAAVATEMAARGLKQAPDAALVVTYYLLLTINIDAQELGQFLPPVTQWGVPPFAPATQSLEVMNHGSLVLDITSKDVIVWRGVADTQIKRETESVNREKIIREAVRDLLKNFPPKK